VMLRNIPPMPEMDCLGMVLGPAGLMTCYYATTINAGNVAFVVWDGAEIIAVIRGQDAA
jgi:hypothetical protein